MAKRSPGYQFTDKAVRDLESIIDYTVQEWGVSQANTYLDGLETRAQLLGENPDLGMARETLSKGYSASLMKDIFCITRKTLAES